MVSHLEISTLSFKCWKLGLKDYLNDTFHPSNDRLRVPWVAEVSHRRRKERMRQRPHLHSYVIAPMVRSAGKGEVGRASRWLSKSLRQARLAFRAGHGWSTWGLLPICVRWSTAYKQLGNRCTWGGVCKAVCVADQLIHCLFRSTGRLAGLPLAFRVLHPCKICK